VEESKKNHLGSTAILDLLAQVVLVHAVRTHVTGLPRGQAGRLKAVVDPEIGPTLGAMHSRLEEPWTVATLAREAGLSRSAYASRFAALLEVPPMRYLLECRMRAASRLLRESRQGLKEIAARAGYLSAPSFNKAFKRWSGRSPGAFRNHGRGARR
jgi:transcriptional regulator GlxA family with amidase domain